MDRCGFQPPAFFTNPEARTLAIASLDDPTDHEADTLIIYREVQPCGSSTPH